MQLGADNNNSRVEGNQGIVLRWDKMTTSNKLNCMAENITQYLTVS